MKFIKIFLLLLFLSAEIVAQVAPSVQQFPLNKTNPGLFGLNVIMDLNFLLQTRIICRMIKEKFSCNSLILEIKDMLSIQIQMMADLQLNV